ncbi:MAG: hypothetical protein IJZ77_04745 [Bacilli bacterium]|nr:hypothetical protein [Bacilli bacterium]
MIQSFLNTLTPLVSNTSSVVFDEDCIRTRSCQGNGWLCHNRGSANYDIVCGGLYEIDFNATVSSAEAGTIAFGLFNNGELIAGTLMGETLAAADDYANIGINKKIKVCCNGDANISVRAIPTVPTPTDPTTPIDTVVPIIASANFSITRLK